jgi:putative transposase
MPEYRRAFLPGGTYFFTVVTFNRKPILTHSYSRQILRNVWRYVQERHPLTVDAICLLPDHMHCIWTLPENDTNYSMRWSAIKGQFSMQYLANGGKEGLRNTSRQRTGEAAIWQRRFWEHLIRDEDDLSHHIDYIHYNPVKHGLVRKAADWEWSSFHRYVRAGTYDREWGEAIGKQVKELICGE